MNSTLHNTILMVITAMLDLMAGFGNLTAGEPLQVYILAGQSNMVGYGGVSTFDFMNADPVTAAILKEMRNPDAMFQQMLALEGTLKPVPGSDVKSEAFRRKNMDVLQGLASGCQILVKRYPNTSAANRANAILEKYR